MERHMCDGGRGDENEALRPSMEATVTDGATN